MFEGILSTLRWLASLGAKFVRVAPGATMVVVLATLVSQVSVLLAFFLPLKVVILLGSDGMPRYFPAAFAEIDRDLLVVSLSVATVVFYVLHLVAERVTTLGTERGSSRLLARSHKMVLFEKQNEAAARGYQRYSYALAGGVFVGLALVLLCFIYPEMAFLLLGYIAVVILLIWAGYSISAAFRVMLDTRLGDFLGIAGAIGFLLAFAYLVLDFIFWSPPGFLLAIISLLLSRQVFTRGTGMVSAIVGLNDQRLKLDALYFHGKVLLPLKEKADKGIWPLLAPERRGVWIGQVLNELVGIDAKPGEINWWQTGEPNVVALKVTGQDEGWLVKLFDVKRSSLALQEASLLAQSHRNLPALDLIGATEVEQFHCHVFGMPPGSTVPDKEVKQTAERLRTRLLAVEPAAGLVKRYTRSRPMLWQHLDEHFVDRLRLAADDEAMAKLDQLEMALNDLRQKLKNLPLWLVNAKINSDTVYRADDGVEYVLHWGRWRLEPVGAGWPIARLSALGDAVVEAARERPLLSDISSRLVELAALADAMHKAFKRQRYVSALEYLSDLLERLDTGDSDR